MRALEADIEAISEIREAYFAALEDLHVDSDTDIALQSMDMTGNQTIAEKTSASEKYSMIGEKGKENDRENKITGDVNTDYRWVTGKDGKLRFEISDASAIINTETLRKAKDAYNRLQNGDTRISVSDLRMKLENVFTHDTLYKLYPDLLNVNVEITDLGVGTKGEYSGNTISIDYRLDPAEARKTMLHEIQHFIQDKEGFAQGGSVENAKIYNMVYAAIYSDRSKFESLTNPQERERFLNDFIEKRYGSANDAAEDTYYELHGEIEARNTANRSYFAQEKIDGSTVINGGIVIYDWSDLYNAYNDVLLGNIESAIEYRRKIHERQGSQTRTNSGNSKVQGRISKNVGGAGVHGGDDGAVGKGESGREGRGGKGEKEGLDHYGTKFSMQDTVEEKDGLIAVHNLSGEQLEQSMDLGGFPMPSIAIVKSDYNHERYGDVSVVFAKETIDPKANKDNKVYGGDAYTPTFPQVEYEADSSVVRRISEKYYQLARTHGHDLMRPLYNYVSDADDTISRNGGEQNTIENLANDTDMMQVFLADTGKSPIETIKKETVTRMSEDDVKLCDHLIASLGADTIRDITPKQDETPMTHRKAWLAAHGDALTEAYQEYLVSLGLSKADAQMVIEKEGAMQMVRQVVMARNYLNNGPEKINTVDDTEATRAAIRKASDKTAYHAWLHDLFAGIEKNKGIYNKQDIFTASGNRRSFTATHWSVTLENIVKAMKTDTSKGGSMFAANGIVGLATKNYKSIADIRADSGRLGTVNEETYEAKKQEYRERFSEIAMSIMRKSEVNQFIALDDAMEALCEAVRRGKTQAGIARVLKEYGHLNVQADTASQMYTLVKELSEMPTEYFEAKPERAVGIDEIRLAVLPEGKYDDLRNQLQQRGIAVEEYDPAVDGDRLRALNSDPAKQLRFSAKDAPSVSEEKINRLTAENEKLTAALELAKVQLEITKGHKLSRKGLETLAGKLTKQWQSTYDRAQLADEMVVLFDYIANAETPVWEEVRDYGVNMARTVLEKSKEKRDSLPSFLHYIAGLGKIPVRRKKKRRSYGHSIRAGRQQRQLLRAGPQLLAGNAGLDRGHGA